MSSIHSACTVYFYRNVQILFSIFHLSCLQVLEFNVEKLRNNLKFCVLDEMVNYTEQIPDTFDEAKQLVKSLWPDWRGPLEAELSLQQRLSGKSLT